MTVIPIVCYNCGSTGETMRVTSSLACPICKTGADLDIWDGEPVTPKIANRWNASDPEGGTWEHQHNDHRPTGPSHAGFGEFMRQQEADERHQMTHPDYDPEDNPRPYDYNTREGKIANAPGGGNGDTGWNKHLPDPTEDWNEYEGPSVHKNPMADTKTDGTADAYDPMNFERGNPSFSPGGGYEKTTWPIAPTTAVPPIESWDPKKGPESGGARWQGKGASVGTPLHVTLPDGTQWEGVGHVVATAKPKPLSQLQKMTKLIKEKNSGLTHDEAVELAKRAQAKWGNN